MSFVYRLSIPHPDRHDMNIDTSTFLFQSRPTKDRMIQVLSCLVLKLEVYDTWVYAAALSLVKRTEFPTDDTYKITTEVYTSAGIQPGIIKLEKVKVY